MLTQAVDVYKRVIQLWKLKGEVHAAKQNPAIFRVKQDMKVYHGTKTITCYKWKPEDDYILANLIL